MLSSLLSAGEAYLEWDWHQKTCHLTVTVSFTKQEKNSVTNWCNEVHLKALTYLILPESMKCPGHYDSHIHNAGMLVGQTQPTHTCSNQRPLGNKQRAEDAMVITETLCWTPTKLIICKEEPSHCTQDKLIRLNLFHEK